MGHLCLVMPAFLFDALCPRQSNGLMTLILKEIKMSSATACQGQTSCGVNQNVDGTRRKPRCKGACAFWRAAYYTSAKKEHTIWGHFFGHCHIFKQCGSKTWCLMSKHCHCSVCLAGPMVKMRCFSMIDRIKQK